jgi:hypothetical protein
MLSQIRRYRTLFSVLAVLLIAGVLVIQNVPFARMVWASLTGGPEMGLVRDVRQSLLEQEEFREVLSAHEEEALRRYRQTGNSALQKRHLVEIDLAPLGLPGFHDVFAVRVRTDVVDDQAYTSFLTRPGVVASQEDAPWFSGQCDRAFCQEAIKLAVRAYHGALDAHLLTPYRLNVTETDRTSSVSIGREPVSTETWAQQSRAMHREGIGDRFSRVR